MTDDDTPLMGEVPDVPARPAVVGDTATAAVRAVAEIRELHRSDSWGDCQDCRMEYPCSTVEILERHGL